MNAPHFAEKHPYLFSALLVLIFFLINAAGVIAAQAMNVPSSSFAILVQLTLVLILAGIVTAMRWWGEIGFRKADSRALLLYVPAFFLAVGNLTFGIQVQAAPALLAFAFLAAASGFVEEVTFRGLMLRAFLGRGGWYAVVASSVIFGLAHSMNVLAGANGLYTLVQIAYALAIGFGFGAAALRGRVLWPLILAHALGNFFAFINSGQTVGGEVSTQMWVVSIVYILWYSVYGLWLMRLPAEQTAPAYEKQ